MAGGFRGREVSGGRRRRAGVVKEAGGSRECWSGGQQRSEGLIVRRNSELNFQRGNGEFRSGRGV